MTFKLSILFILIFAFAASCKTKKQEQPAPSIGQPAEPLPVNEEEVTVTIVGHLSADTLKMFAKNFGMGSLTSKIRYDVNIGKISYKTSYKDRKVTASGLIYIPDTAGISMPVLCLNHGTTFLKSEAPSVNPGISGAELAASNGFMTVMPDYLGYGASADLFHPYYDAKHSASAVIDIINAARNYNRKQGRELNSKVFLAGYSEGGYVTLAAQKAIESRTDLGWKLMAVAAGAGGYDLQQMLNSMIAGNYYSYPAYLAFIIQSFNTTYNWNKDLSYFFRSRYAGILDKSLNGYTGGGTINSQLTTRLDSLFSDSFYAAVKNDTASEFMNALKKNSLSDWTPLTPLKLYHGTSDEIIPYSNSQYTLQKLKEAGAVDAELILIPGGTHGSTFVPMIQKFFPWFEQLK